MEEEGEEIYVKLPGNEKNIKRAYVYANYILARLSEINPEKEEVPIHFLWIGIPNERVNSLIQEVEKELKDIEGWIFYRREKRFEPRRIPVKITTKDEKTGEVKERIKWLYCFDLVGTKKGKKFGEGIVRILR